MDLFGEIWSLVTFCRGRPPIEFRQEVLRGSISSSNLDQMSPAVE